MKQVTPMAAAVLRLRGLHKRFGRVDVLRGLDMTVYEGEVYGFLGRNGSGKTTTIRTCMGIVAASSGEIELLGETSRRPTMAQKREIGYVSQEQYFYPWMRCEALGRFVGSFFPAWDREEFARLLRVLDLPPKRKVSQLSGGMRAKLGVALALAHRPRLLLLDEPTAGLDPAARREFIELIRGQARKGGYTTVFSSHIVEEIERVADRVGILDRGQMVFEGDLTTLRETVRRFQPVPPPVPVDPAPESGSAAEAETGHSGEGRWSRLPDGFECLFETDDDGRRSLVLRAAPQIWEAAVLPAGEVFPMTVEDIFLGLTVGRHHSA